MNGTELAKILQDLLVEVMDRWNDTHVMDPLRKMPWERLDPISRQLYVQRCEAFLERYDVLAKPAEAPPRDQHFRDLYEGDFSVPPPP